VRCDYCLWIEQPIYLGRMDNGEVSETHLCESELFKIKLSFSSLSNRVIVCPVVATLYSWKPTDIETWTYVKTGIPVLVIVHDVQNKSKNTQMELCMVDRSNRFANWRENITEASEYKVAQRNFHTMKLSNPKEEGEMVGLKFPSEEIAAVFYKDVQCNIPDESELEMNQSPKHGDKKRSVKSKDRLSKRLSKDDISSPCMFTHVTSINNSTLAEERGKKNAGAGENGRQTFGFIKRMSLSTRKR